MAEYDSLDPTVETDGWICLRPEQFLANRSFKQRDYSI